MQNNFVNYLLTIGVVRLINFQYFCILFFLSMILRSLKYLVIWFLLSNAIFAEIKITIPNRTIERGRLDTIAILGDFGTQSFAKLNLVLQFNAYLIDLQKVISEPSNVIVETEPNFNVQLNQLYDATVSITSSKLNLNINGEKTICKLVIEGLVYQDSVDTIRLLKVELDDDPVGFTFEGGKITVSGPLVYPVKENYLSEAFPIPSASRVLFRFGIVKPSYIELKIFNSNGEIVFTSQNTEYFKISGTKGVVSTKDKLDAGDYWLELLLPPDFASGCYFLQLNAFSVGVFNSKFLIIK